MSQCLLLYITQGRERLRIQRGVDVDRRGGILSREVGGRCRELHNLIWGGRIMMLRPPLLIWLLRMVLPLWLLQQLMRLRSSLPRLNFGRKWLTKWRGGHAAEKGGWCGGRGGLCRPWDWYHDFLFRFHGCRLLLWLVRVGNEGLVCLTVSTAQ